MSGAAIGPRKCLMEDIYGRQLCSGLLRVYLLDR